MKRMGSLDLNSENDGDGNKMTHKLQQFVNSNTNTQGTINAQISHGRYGSHVNDSKSAQRGAYHESESVDIELTEPHRNDSDTKNQVVTILSMSSDPIAKNDNNANTNNNASNNIAKRAMSKDYINTM